MKRIFATRSVEAIWQRFHASYPRSSLVGLSAMRFRRDGLQALAYVEFPGWYGGYYLVTRIHACWSVAGKWNCSVR